MQVPKRGLSCWRNGEIAHVARGSWDLEGQRGRSPKGDGEVLGGNIVAINMD